MRLAVRLYPAAWRERYGEEMERLLLDRPPGPRATLDLAMGALDAHLHGLGRSAGQDAGWASLPIGAGAITAGALWVVGIVGALGMVDMASAAELPIGLAHGVSLERDVPQGATVTYADVRLDETDPVVRLRRELEQRTRVPA